MKAFMVFATTGWCLVKFLKNLSGWVWDCRTIGTHIRWYSIVSGEHMSTALHWRHRLRKERADKGTAAGALAGICTGTAAGCPEMQNIALVYGVVSEGQFIVEFVKMKMR